MTSLFPIIKILLIIGISLLLSGCITGTQILKAHSTEEGFLKKENSRSLVGVQKDLILQKYGTPALKFNYENNSYFLYTSAGEIDSQLDIIFPFEFHSFLYDKHSQICVLLMFDQSDSLKKVQYYVDNDGDGGLNSFCLYPLFPEDKAMSLLTSYLKDEDSDFYNAQNYKIFDTLSSENKLFVIIENLKNALGNGSIKETRQSSSIELLATLEKYRGMVSKSDTNQACIGLTKAYWQSDGSNQTPDLIEGRAREVISTQILYLLLSIDCQPSR